MIEASVMKELKLTTIFAKRSSSKICNRVLNAPLFNKVNFSFLTLSICLFGVSLSEHVDKVCLVLVKEFISQ